MATNWVEHHSIRPPSMQFERAPNLPPYPFPPPPLPQLINLKPLCMVLCVVTNLLSGMLPDAINRAKINSYRHGDGGVERGWLGEGSSCRPGRVIERAQIFVPRSYHRGQCKRPPPPFPPTRVSFRLKTGVMFMLLFNQLADTGVNADLSHHWT